ncbi:hypothetical protein Vadar_009386 [Vaccinium darrowii]|uniref:Uncharacterized protein n=1 Tax=Vaccinium darrowii TaxID=229202 RepID=A0ACB7Z352_9ERIC|nr:hypothetical protein Vadar_009386 [Vaccinium darrowii]
MTGAMMEYLDPTITEYPHPTFTLYISFGGRIVRREEIKYDGGLTVEVKVSPESCTYSDVVYSSRDFGLKGTFSIYYMQPNFGMKSTLVALTNDGELSNVFAIGGSKNENNLFVDGGYEGDEEEEEEDACQNVVEPPKVPLPESSKSLPEHEKQPYIVMAKLDASQLAEEKPPRAQKPRKVYMQNRIALPSVVKLMQKLTEEQREAVKSMGLGGLLELRCSRLHHDLLEWLVDNFDPSRCLLRVHERELVLIVTEVQRFLGIHGCGLDIMLTGFSDDGFKKLCDDLKVNKGSLMLKDLGDCNNVTLKFNRIFVLYMLGSFLCPTSQPYVPQNYVHVVRDVDTLNGRNWAKLTLQCLANGISESKRLERRCTNGCLFLLELFYVERVIPATCRVVRDPSMTPLAYCGLKKSAIFIGRHQREQKSYVEEDHDEEFEDISLPLVFVRTEECSRYPEHHCSTQRAETRNVSWAILPSRLFTYQQQFFERMNQYDTNAKAPILCREGVAEHNSSWRGVGGGAAALEEPDLGSWSLFYGREALYTTKLRPFTFNEFSITGICMANMMIYSPANILVDTPTH